MSRIQAQFLGVELYFENLEGAKKFYLEALNLTLSDEKPGHHARFAFDAGFICLERKGAESYPSKDKAVLFFEVPDLNVAITAIGRSRVVQSEPTWAVLHDPEGHNMSFFRRQDLEKARVRISAPLRAGQLNRRFPHFGQSKLLTAVFAKTSRKRR